ncbi:MAG: copper-binding protein [Lysobacter sp.]
MKIAAVLLPIVLLAGCSSPDSTSPSTATAPAPAESAPTPAPAGSAPAPAAAAPAVESPATATASASGVVESVDASAKSVTIATDAVEALKWPAMTMTYRAPDIDLSTIKQGDKVSFEFTAVGMDGTISSIARR